MSNKSKGEDKMSVAQLMIVSSLSSLIKLLFVPAYKSTDFEVHRNWLSITHKLPYNRWYFENTSEWTLDYPPYFAWFEYGLSQVGQYFDDGKGMLDILRDSPNSQAALYFQRLSVIVTDFVLCYGTYRCCVNLSPSHTHGKASALQEKFEVLTLLVLVIFNAGLFIVDHIHFQYNGFLFGILLLSLANILQQNILWGSFWFAVLLNFKHIFLYMAPAYGVFLLRTYCMNPKQRGLAAFLSFNIVHFLSLAAMVIGVFLTSFGPFMHQISQVISRLFPFKRGLTHAYWAPNFWAVYNTVDKMLSIAGRRLNLLSVNESAKASFSKGLVEEAEHVVLPSITPFATVVIVLISILPCLTDMWIWPRSLSPKHLSNQFLRGLVLVSLSSFMFGWHVHEKAILMVIIPLAVLALRGTRKDAEIFVLIQAVGHYSLFPLLYMPFETVIKICLALLYAIFTFSSFQKISKSSLTETSRFCLPLLNRFETAYLCGLIICEIYANAIHRSVSILKNFPFLPLMITSSYCACGIVWCWIKLYFAILKDRGGYPIEWGGNSRQKEGSPVKEKRHYLRKTNKN